MKSCFEVKDHSVTGESFRLEYDQELHMYITTPKPSEIILPKYYASEDYISHTDGRRSFFEKAYHIVKQITLSRKQNLLLKYLPSRGQLLDIGAGTGDFLEYALKKGWNVSGVEPSAKARALARQKKITLIDDLSDDATLYDAITMWHVLEHVYDLDNQIKWIKNHLHPDGVVFIAVPNFECLDAQYYKTDWAAFDVPRHLYHFSKKSIRSLFGKKGMKVIDIVPMKFDAYYVSLLSEKYKTGSMNFIKAFWMGLRSNLSAKRTGAYSSLIYVIKHT